VDANVIVGDVVARAVRGTAQLAAGGGDCLHVAVIPAARRQRRGATVLLLLMSCMLTACAMGDIFNGPLPVDVTAEQITGTWVGRDDAGNFAFAADGTLTASDLPVDALPPLEASNRWSCVGTWRITSPIGGDSKQRNIVELDLRGLPGVDGGYGGHMSASKPRDVIVLSMGNYSYTRN
jgi:hypothetical protein